MNTQKYIPKELHSHSEYIPKELHSHSEYSLSIPSPSLNKKNEKSIHVNSENENTEQSEIKVKSTGFLVNSPRSNSCDTILIDNYINRIEFINKIKYKICFIVYTAIIAVSGYLFYKYI